jgi:hypothetical protein
VTQWLPVPGYEGLYQVSDDGQVLSAPRPRARGGLLKQFDDGHGYPHVTLTRGGRQKRFGVHQLVALAFIGPRPPGQEVRHLDGNSANPAVSNLAYGTHVENLLDKRRHGTDHNAKKTHCPAGHPYDEANTFVFRGSRYCRACAREQHGYKGNPLPGDRTHCPQGHPYDEVNTYKGPAGRRQCRTCRRERQQRAKDGTEACAIDGCEKAVMARGWCTTHYARWSKHGDPLYEVTREPVICSEEECGTVAIAQGLCRKHYSRKRRAGELASRV